MCVNVLTHCSGHCLYMYVCSVCACATRLRCGHPSLGMYVGMFVYHTDTLCMHVCLHACMDRRMS
jgi:hypothetical protein